MNWKILSVSMLLLLQACATVPAVTLPANCPEIPELQKAPVSVREPSFLERIRSFLSGKLPEQTKSEPN